ncbi:hypothetical protein V565_229910, partial [Rhizoctonia solani 123E]
MDSGNKTAETLIDNPETPQTYSAETDMDLDDSPVHPLNPSLHESKHIMPYSTAEVFPMLGPAPDRLRVSLMELIQKLPDTYLDNEDNLENCRRVPEWLDCAVQAISRVSGAILDVRAICLDSEDPETIKCYTQNEEMSEELAYLAHLVFRSFGPAMERHAPHTFPTVYSNASVRGRPLLCPMHPNPKQRCLTLIDYMTIYRRWECGDQIEWGDISKDIELFIESPRYGEDVHWGTGPHHWDDETVRRCYLHIYTCQERLLAQDMTAESTAFQWILKARGEPYIYEPWGSIVGLYGNENAAYSVAMACYYFPSHAYHPHIVCDPVWYHTSLVEKLVERFRIPQSLVEVMDLTEINESMSPPIRTASHGDLAILNLFCGRTFDLFDRLHTVVLPLAMCDWGNTEHDRYSARRMYIWVVLEESLIFEDRVMGRPEGVLKLIMGLLAFCRLIHEMDLNQVPLSGHMYRLTWDHPDGQQILFIINYLKSALTRSIESDARPSIFPGMQEDRWSPKRLLHHQLGKGTPVEMPWPYEQWGTSNPQLSSPFRPIHQERTGIDSSTKQEGLFSEQQVATTGKSEAPGTVPLTPTAQRAVPPSNKGKSADRLHGSVSGTSSGMSDSKLFPPTHHLNAGLRGTPHDEPRQPGRPRMVVPPRNEVPNDDASQLVSPKEPDMIVIDDDLAENSCYGELTRSKQPFQSFSFPGRLLGDRTVSGPPRASTGETRPTPLPRVPEEKVSRRSQSLDPPILTGGSGNALGLQVPLNPGLAPTFGHSLGPQSRSDLTFEGDLPSSTPQQKQKPAKARHLSGGILREVYKAVSSEDGPSRSDKGPSAHEEQLPRGKATSRSKSRDKASSSSRSPLVDSPALALLPDEGGRASSTVGRRTQTPVTSTSQLPPETPLNQGEGKDNYLLQAAALVKRGRTPGPST